jgi:pimeloyl-ACP methyl ester carboxylesterase
VAGHPAAWDEEGAAYDRRVPAPPRLVSHGLPLKAHDRVGPARLAFVESEAPSAGLPVVVLLHGFPTHAFLWRRVVRRLEGEAHCLAVDLLGLGDTEVSPYEDFSLPMQAEVILDWLDQRDLDQVVLVGHEQGGGVVQQLVANHPERVSGMVLVDSVAYDNWPIPVAAQVMRLARTPGVDVLAYALELPRRLAHNGLVGFRHAVHDPSVITDDIIAEYLRPFATAEGRERARRFLLAGSDRYTLECLPGLRAFDGPAAVVWGADDHYLSSSWGQRLVDDLAGAARLDLVPFCGHLVPEERPDAVATAVQRVVAASAERQVER